MIWCFRQGSFGCWCCLLPMWVAGCFKYLCMYYMLVYPGTTHTHTPTHTTRHSRRSGINANKWKHKYFQRFVVRANLFGTGQAQINLPEVGQGSERWAHWPERPGPDRTRPDRWIISAVMARFLRVPFLPWAPSGKAFPVIADAVKYWNLYLKSFAFTVNCELALLVLFFFFCILY